MTQPQPDIEARLSAVEERLEVVAADAAAARHLAAARDRDLADLGVKVDANRSAINALGVQTNARFERLEHKFDDLERKVDGLQRGFDQGFAEMRGKFDQMAAGQQAIVTLLNTVIDRRDEQ